VLAVILLETIYIPLQVRKILGIITDDYSTPTTTETAVYIMMARTYIENNFQRRYRNSLLKGIGKNMRKHREITLQEYTVDNLANDYKSGTVAEMQGIGKKQYNGWSRNSKPTDICN